MSKGYKKEYIDKVKQKFNDIQSGHKENQRNAGITCNDKASDNKQSSKLVILDRAANVSKRII